MTATNGASLMGCLNEIDDPRKPSNGTLHDLREIFVIAIAATLSDSDTIEDIAFWARKKEVWLHRFLELKNGIPSEDTFLYTTCRERCGSLLRLIPYLDLPQAMHKDCLLVSGKRGNCHD
jgi:hypothetical protein